MPAHTLEKQLATITLKHLEDRLPIDLFRNLSADSMVRIKALLSALSASPIEQSLSKCLSCIEDVKITPGAMHIVLDAQRVAEWSDLALEAINPDILAFDTPFQFRKRGVEVKLVVGTEQAASLDQTLISNIAKAQHYYDAVKQGQPFNDIAARDGISKRRMLHLINLAFLAPDLVKLVLEGRQPVGLTTEWLLRNSLPADWDEQRRLISSL
ncbi:MAG: hypothetical protein N4A65_05280 [Cohaesibacter sp.]|nr:hypothetical protein [Cohaesibacter sp.]